MNDATKSPMHEPPRNKNRQATQTSGESDSPVSIVQARSLDFGYSDHRVIDHLDFSLFPGQVVGLVGPNGAGKSTLLKLICGLEKPDAGTLLVDGQPLDELGTRRLARLVAYVPQDIPVNLPFSVEEVVLTGRRPHQGPLAFASDRDLDIARTVMDATSISHLSQRPYIALSGGERQRVMLAAALTQQPKLLVLDEPTSNLDMSHQVAVMRILRDTCARRQIAAIIALHDWNLAIRWAQHIWVIDKGAFLAQGKPAHVVTASLIETLFGQDVSTSFLDEAPLVLPIAGRS
ncbi:MAG: ABC transporter ATP-binding protein [Deltaproteobacteria bacterium]|nr:ABC transporter ATP-binding protein [Deltaproteobacteria bacterium]